MSNLTKPSFNLMGGKLTDLSEYHGSVVLIVNVDSACGLTPQYVSLQKIYAAQGLVVLGFPVNNFAGTK